jgi:hypothetical protein
LLASEWTLAEALPADYRDKLPVALEVVQRTLVSVTNAEFFDTIGELIDWADLFGLTKMPVDERERGRKAGMISRLYWQTLGDLPADLLDLALKRTMAGHSYTVMPLPGEIRAYVAPEMARRKLMALRLETALMFARFEEPPLPDREKITPEQRKAVSDALGSCTKRVPAEPTDAES